MTRQPRAVLALNLGSSSLKFALHRTGEPGLPALLAGEVEGLGGEQGRLRVRGAQGEALRDEAMPGADAQAVIARLRRLIEERATPPPEAIGHRLVHGGPELCRDVRLDAAVLARLERAAAFAPLHVPAALAVIRAAAEHFPGLPQVACLDTGFHADLPTVARTLPLDRALYEAGVRRYGFHGLSCASILAQWTQALPSRLVIAHLGSGASVTAVREGRSVDTSMGMTPSGGVMMATRCGDLDPGVLAYLAREKHMDAAAIEQLVDHRSGLLGVSGLSGDMRALRRAAASHPSARLAIDLFVHTLRKQIAAMIAVLGGVDALVFTGGIGEHDADTREAVCDGLAWAGVVLDPGRNRNRADPVSTDASPCLVRVLPAQEERQICRQVWQSMA
ncbi:acetate/propionate family kinase [Frateuria defendens]|uniref:acetate/propionate family kinase n=1 Tax=Frateuria defendens TaxID=2219559 RepID=UPI0009E1DC2F|nr:acetate/propionate family kinase [Frateuria defendens]